MKRKREAPREAPREAIREKCIYNRCSKKKCSFFRYSQKTITTGKGQMLPKKTGTINIELKSNQTETDTRQNSNESKKPTNVSSE